MKEVVLCKNCYNYHGPAFRVFGGCYAYGEPILIKDPVTGTETRYTPGARQLAQCVDRLKVPYILNKNHDCAWYKPKLLHRLLLLLGLGTRRVRA